jgi:hypothetical protein
MQPRQFPEFTIRSHQLMAAFFVLGSKLIFDEADKFLECEQEIAADAQATQDEDLREIGCD